MCNPFGMNKTNSLYKVLEKFLDLRVCELVLLFQMVFEAIIGKVIHDQLRSSGEFVDEELVNLDDILMSK